MEYERVTEQIAEIFFHEGLEEHYTVRQLDNIIDQILSLDGIEIRADNMPKIICLCGSTRFTVEMLIKQWELAKQGYVVLSWCALPNDYYLEQGYDEVHHIGDQEGVKQIVDEVHLRKIDLADEVFVLNIGEYIGESTRNEINYAIKIGKPVHYLEPSSRK